MKTNTGSSQTPAAGNHRNTLPRKQKSLTSFRSRLHWHCHLIQKLEDEPELEFRAMHRELEGMKTGPNDSERLQRWQQGQTGWPLVDACMRSLQHTGWLNFRKQYVSREETGRVLDRHGSRKGPHQTRPKAAGKQTPDNQLSLFD